MPHRSYVFWEHPNRGGKEGVNIRCKTRIFFRVVDNDGFVVTNAFVKAGFYLNDEKGNAVSGFTDKNGLLLAEKRSVGQVNYWIRKNGYYETSGRIQYYDRSIASVSDGRWQPYGATNTVVLKRIVNPVAMYVASSPSVLDIIMPLREVPVGFDFEKCDWISPYGNGVNADVQFKHEFRQGKEFLDVKSVLTISFTNAFSGAYVMEKDSFSAFPTVYEVNTNANFSTEHRFVYDRRPDKVLENSFLPSSRYLVFRCRTKVDKDGNLISSRYGKIYGDIDINRKGRIRTTYYFNPNENDTNLEADTTRNLLKPKVLGFSP